MQQEYCPPIDPSLISAIYSDFVGQHDAIGSARQLLDTLKESAVAEQLTEFEPSGHQATGFANSNDDNSNPDVWATQTILSDHSTFSTDNSTFSAGGRSGNSSEESYSGGYFKDTEHFDIQTKELLLAETFPSLSVEKIAYTLRKCGNDFSQATDELLNHVYFEDTRTKSTKDEPVVRGIDAFSEEHHVPQRRKKGKGKKKQRIELSDSGSNISSESDLSSVPATNHWLNTSRDVEFISSRTNLSAKTVSSVYHANGASLSATILELVRKENKEREQEGEPDAVVLQNAIALNSEFPTIDLHYCLAITRLTNPSTSRAHELAKALIQLPAGGTRSTGGIKLDLRYAPLDFSDSTTIESPKLPSLAPAARPRDLASTTRARNEAFQQASIAYRKGKSTPLMRAAAGYYAQEGRDLSANLKAMGAAEADALVSSQSGAAFLDLHGVTVADATRIAKQRTRAWWNDLGEQRIPEWSGPGRRGGGEVFKIITGLGRHSEGGRGKLGPAVAKALVNEGWKVEIQPGELFVTGLARRR